MEERAVKIRISARHVHLTKEMYYQLFNHELTKKNDLNQIGEFASNETVTIKTSKDSINNVRIIGPLRSYNQVELSRTDARKLGINPPVRRSGNVIDSEVITLETSMGKVEIPAAIIAERHVHMNEEMARDLDVCDGDIVYLELGTIKKGIIEIKVKVSSNGVFEVHLDTDDANAFLINDGDMGRLLI